jgi:hypothetical protein
MDPLIVRALPEIDGKQLRQVAEVSVNINNGDTKVVKTMNADNVPVGYTDGVTDVDFDLKVVVTNPPETDWEDLQRNRREFLFTYMQIDASGGGRRFGCVRSRVIKIGKPFSQNGEFMQSISLLCLQHRPE